MMKLSISEITTLPVPLKDDLPAFAAAGWGAVELSLEKAMRFREEASLAGLKEMLSRLKLKPVAAIGLAPKGQALLLSRGAAFDDYLRGLTDQIAFCAELGIPDLGVGADHARWITDPDWHTGAIANLKAAGAAAADQGVRLGIESLSLGPPIGPFILESLAETLALTRAADHPAVAVNIDFFHFYRSGGTAKELAALDRKEIANVHVTDVRPLAREKLGDGDRVLPGEGTLPLGEYRDAILSTGYDGYWCLELLNEDLWRKDPKEVATVGLRAMQAFAATPATAN